MTAEICYFRICFVPPSPAVVPNIFGFAEFISSLALLIIVYTVVDVRYRFRIAIAPFPLRGFTFIIIAVIGIGTLLTDVWLTEGWWVLKIYSLSGAVWQGLFGLLFLCVFMIWMYFAFIRPPVFSKNNFGKFAASLYGIIVRGSDHELSVIGDELSRSARSIVNFAHNVPARVALESRSQNDRSKNKRDRQVEDCAYDILLLIANRKLCRNIVQSSQATALFFFGEMLDAKKFNIPFGPFARNISAEAIANKDSFIYHESDGFTSGLLGYLKPFSHTIYGEYELVEGLADQDGSPLDIDYLDMAKWDSTEWEAYCRLTLVTLKSYLHSSYFKNNNHSYAIHRAFTNIRNSVQDTYKLNNVGEDYYTTDIYKRLSVAVHFLNDAVTLIDELENPPNVISLRKRKDRFGRSIYDTIAANMCELIYAASSISKDADKCWDIHHNMVWSNFFPHWDATGPAWKIVNFKLRRLLYDEIAKLSCSPNYKGARILGICLNVLGLKSNPNTNDKSDRLLTKIVQTWVSREYLTLCGSFPDVASACLIGGITFEEKEHRLVKTYLKGLHRDPAKDYLEIRTSRD